MSRNDRMSEGPSGASIADDDLDLGPVEKRFIGEVEVLSEREAMLSRLKQLSKQLVQIYDRVGTMDFLHDVGGAADVMIPSGTADLASYLIAMRYWNKEIESTGSSEKLIKELKQRVKWIQRLDAAGPAALEAIAEYGPAAIGFVVGSLGGPVGSVGGGGLGYTGGQLSHIFTLALDRSFRANELSAMVFAEHLRIVMDEARAMGIDPLKIDEVKAAHEKVLELKDKRRKRMFGLLKLPQQGMEKFFTGHDPDTWAQPKETVIEGEES